MATRSGLRRSVHEFTVSGEDSEVVEYDFFPDSAKTPVSGSIRRLVVREGAGGGATATDIYFAHLNYKEIADPTAVGAEQFTAVVEALTLTASATALSLDSPITAEPAFQSSLTAVFDVTGSGAWTILGWVEIES